MSDQEAATATQGIIESAADQFPGIHERASHNDKAIRSGWRTMQDDNSKGWIPYETL